VIVVFEVAEAEAEAVTFVALIPPPVEEVFEAVVFETTAELFT
jgi:uncharacterized protein YndB with AHSA1/START domain